jgi:ActR/RegA family two-component response regulator
VEIAVSDTGGGIPAEVVPRSSSSSSRRSRRGPARAFDHQADRRGARRRVTWDNAGPRRDVHDPAADQASAKWLSPATLLVADDDPGLRESLERTLTREGYRVVLASTDALRSSASSRRRRPDRHRSAHAGLTGLELLRAAKAIMPDVDVILLTAFGTVEEAVKAMKDGAYDFLTKPFRASSSSSWSTRRWSARPHRAEQGPQEAARGPPRQGPDDRAPAPSSGA